MTTSKLDRLRAVFGAALELPADARLAFLNRECFGDIELRRRVEVMLAAAEGDTWRVDSGSRTPTLALATPLDDAETLREGPGTRIGHYQLLEELGQGGFGVVFLAEQSEPVRRRVALKIIKLGMDTREVVARFEQERQALALMDHPGIAHVIDAGATATGRPYFVMELVRGQPIDVYCDEQRLSIDERLELFAQVCAAVQHAHQRGIIHRDLKPSNILVATHGGRAHAKIIDFGIAKATSARLTDKTVHTEDHQIIGTLTYMSPEQARGSLDIDTRTDVYSLGVVLYELLTGSTPFRASTSVEYEAGELQRMIREEEPAAPSTRLRSSTQNLERVAERRKLDARKLCSVVRGELDWIVMKALEKERTRRYETASEFAADVRRFLGREAVLAAPPSARYRMAKFVRRHRTAAAAALGVSISLTLGVVGFAWQARVAARERDDALAARQAEELERKKADALRVAEAEQRATAERNERKAKAVNDLLVGMLESADLRHVGREARVSDALAGASESLATQLEGEPEVAATVHQILGRTYLSLGMLDESEPHVAAALDLQRALHGEESVEFVRALSSQASLARERGRREESLEFNERAFDIARRLRGPEDEFTISISSDYANALAAAGRNEEAETLFRQALELGTAERGTSPRERVVLMNSLAVLLHGKGSLDEAEELYRAAAQLGAEELGPTKADALVPAMNLTSLLSTRGRHAEAEPLMRATFEAMRRTYGDAHSKTGDAANMLGLLYVDLGRFKDAVTAFEDSVAIRTRAEGDSSLDVAQSKFGLGRALNRIGQFERGLVNLREALAIREAQLGADHRDTLMVRTDLANGLSASAQHDEAAAQFELLLEACPRVFGEDSPETIIATNSLAVLRLNQSRWADAEPLLRKALEAGRRVEGEDARNTIITQYNLASAARELGRLEEAESIGRDVLGRFERVFGAQHGNVAAAQSSLALTLRKLGHVEEAEQSYRQAIAVASGAFGVHSPTSSSYVLGLAELCDDGGRASEAEAMLRELITALQGKLQPDDRRVLALRVELGRALTLLARFDEAERELLEAQSALSTGGATSAARHKTCCEQLVALYEAWQHTEPARRAELETWRAKVAELP